MSNGRRVGGGTFSLDTSSSSGRSTNQASLVDYLIQQGLSAGQQSAQSTSSSSSSSEVTIPRRTTVQVPKRLWNRAPTPMMESRRTTVGVPLDTFVREFYDKWDDPNFQTWFMSRTLASGVTDDKATYSDYLNAWVKAGQAVANGAWSGTPEQYLEWIATGQQVSADDVEQEIKAGQPVIDPETDQPVLPSEQDADQTGLSSSAAVNPITTYKSTSSATINRQAAYAAADQLGQQLLGRMLTKGEMRKAYRVMNHLLAENPTVTTTRRDATDPYNVVESSHTSQGMSASDAEAVLQQKMQRSSEGSAYTVGNMFEDAMKFLASKEG